MGKAMTHEIEGPHAEIGAQLASKYEIDSKVVTTIREHHDSEFTTTESFIVAAADAISASRPGARDSAEAYIKRLKDIEEIALGFEGVDKCFAIEAGRELRVLVDPVVVDDDETPILAKNIVEKIESSLNYQAKLKV